MDDILIQGSSPSQVYLHAQVAALLFMVLGWSLIWKNSVFFPRQQTAYLELVLDSLSMSVSCSPDKIARLQSMCRNIMKDGTVSVHDAEPILGSMESVCLVSPLCALHYRAFRKQLLGAKASARRPKQVFHLSSKTIASLAWWVSPAGFAAYASAPIRELDPTIEFWTDASLEHGGGLSFHGGFVQRSWTSSGLADDPSTNLLETRAACESVMALSEPGDHVRLHIDYRTAAAFFRCQGGTRRNVLSQEVLLL